MNEERKCPDCRVPLDRGRCPLCGKRVSRFHFQNWDNKEKHTKIRENVSEKQSEKKIEKKTNFGKTKHVTSRKENTVDISKVNAIIIIWVAVITIVGILFFLMSNVTEERNWSYEEETYETNEFVENSEYSDAPEGIQLNIYEEYEDMYYVTIQNDTDEVYTGIVGLYSENNKETGTINQIHLLPNESYSTLVTTTSKVASYGFYMSEFQEIDLIELPFTYTLYSDEGSLYFETQSVVKMSEMKQMIPYLMQVADEKGYTYEELSDRFLFSTGGNMTYFITWSEDENGTYFGIDKVDEDFESVDFQIVYVEDII